MNAYGNINGIYTGTIASDVLHCMAYFESVRTSNFSSGGTDSNARIMALRDFETMVEYKDLYHISAHNEFPSVVSLCPRASFTQVTERLAIRYKQRGTQPSQTESHLFPTIRQYRRWIQGPHCLCRLHPYEQWSKLDPRRGLRLRQALRIHHWFPRMFLRARLREKKKSKKSRKGILPESATGDVTTADGEVSSTEVDDPT